MNLTAVYRKVPQGYVAFVEARENLREAISLVLEANRQMSRESLEDDDVLRERLDYPSAA